MTLTNYWWLLIWIFIGGVLALFIPKQQELVNGRKVERWTMPTALILIAPYIVWAGFRSNAFGDSLLSSKLQKNMSEKWLLFKKATFSDCIEVSFL